MAQEASLLMAAELPGWATADLPDRDIGLINGWMRVRLR